MGIELPGLPFTITGVLGQGGMGVVYQARDPELDRDLAIKVPTSALNPTQRTRFLREGETTAKLEHPGILRVHAAGVLEDGRPWLAYELVEEPRALDARWAEQDLVERVEMVRDAARAVGYAHQQGVVHRDIKAENVLVDREGRIRVADFGLALTAGQDRLTQTGAMLGTPAMMSPEQITASQDVGPQTDVWALGVLLYEALTGEYPFDSRSWPELIAAIGKATPTPPRRLRPEVPRALEAVALRCLQSTIAKRYPDGEALAAAIDEALAGGSRPWRLALGGLVAVGALIAAGLWATRPAPEVEPTPTATASPSPPSPEPTPTPSPPPAGPVERAERLLPKDPQAAGALLREAAAAGDARAQRRLTVLLAKERIPARPGEDVIKLLQGGARAGDADACTLLAIRLQEGRGVPHDPQRAVVLLQRAAEQGHAGAAALLAFALRVGRGVRKDVRRALTWAHRAAAAEQPQGLAFLALALNDGRGVPASRSEAKRYLDRLTATGHPLQHIVRGVYLQAVDPRQSLAAFRRGAALGHGQSLYYVGYAHQKGWGTEPDDRQALAWYRKAAAVGDRQGMRSLARFLLRGRGGASTDPERAVALLTELWKRGYPKAGTELARIYAEGRVVAKDEIRASRLLRKAADWGYAPAAVLFGKRLEQGLGLKKRDPEAAARYYEQAAAAGEPAAFTNLAQLYKLGYGVAQDLNKAFELFKRGATAGDLEATYRLALMYKRGAPVEQSDAQALKLFRAAAEARHRKAAYQLGLALEGGLGVDRDLAQAAVWYRKAADAALPEAMVRLAKLLRAGRGVDRDEAAATALLKRAARLGDAEAKRLLKPPGN